MCIRRRGCGGGTAGRWSTTPAGPVIHRKPRIPRRAPSNDLSRSRHHFRCHRGRRRTLPGPPASGRIQLHRLVQAVIRNQLPPADRDADAGAVLSLLAAAHPGDPHDPADWAPFAGLSPHILATSTLADHRSDNRRTVLDTVTYLYARGDNRATRGIANELLERWRRVIGPDNPDCLRLAASLAIELTYLGDTEDACALGEETLRRAERALGSDHPITMIAAGAAVSTLALWQAGQVERVRSLGEDTLNRCRDILGPNHATTLGARGRLDLGSCRRRRRQSVGQPAGRFGFPTTGS